MFTKLCTLEKERAIVITMNKINYILKALRMKSGDSLRDMAKKINISPSYLSSIENEKREVPADLGDKLVVAYNLNSEESKQVHEAIAESMNVVKVKTDELTPEEKRLIFAISKGNLAKEDISQMCEVIDKKEGK